MSQRFENGYIALFLTCVVMLIIIGFVSWSFMYSKGYQAADEDHQSAYATHQSSKEIYDECVSKATIEDALRCYKDSYNTDREQERAEDDLDAQREMANWAEGMLWATLFIGTVTAAVTALGVMYVAKTLSATSETLEAARATNKIMQDEQRPWLKVVADGPQKIIDPEGALFTFWIENRGNSPARNIVFNIFEGGFQDKQHKSITSGHHDISIIFPNDTAWGCRHRVNLGNSGMETITAMVKYTLPNGEDGYTVAIFRKVGIGKIVRVDELPGGHAT